MPTVQPPDVPQSFDPNVRDYLRRLNTWAYQEIDKKVPKGEAVPQLLLSASDQKTPTSIFQVGVNSSGRLQTTPVTLASGDQGDALAFAPITLSGMRQTANVSGTVSQTPVMMGLGFILSLQTGTRLWATVNGTVANNGGGTTILELRYGTGAAPSNGAPGTGTPIGLSQGYRTFNATDFSPFSLTGVIQVTPLQSYWVDIAMWVGGAGTSSISNITASGMELP